MSFPILRLRRISLSLLGRLSGLSRTRVWVNTHHPHRFKTIAWVVLETIGTGSSGSALLASATPLIELLVLSELSLSRVAGLTSSLAFALAFATYTDSTSLIPLDLSRDMMINII